MNLRGDSIGVVDAGLLRLSVLDRSGRYVRAVPLPFTPVDFCVDAGGDWVVAAAGRSSGSDRELQPIHRLSPAGTIRTSFGGPVVPRDGMMAATQRVLGCDASGGVWSSRPDRYELEHWNARGMRTHVVRRYPDWFPDRPTSGTRRDWRTPPPSRVRDIFVDTAGRLWVIVTVVKTNWRASPENFGGVETDGQNLDTILEVIDPSSGHLLASRRFPWVARQFTHDGLLATYRTDADGVLAVNILRATLRQP